MEGCDDGWQVGGTQDGVGSSWLRTLWGVKGGKLRTLWGVKGGKLRTLWGVKGGKSVSDDIAGGLACWLCVIFFFFFLGGGVGGGDVMPDILCLSCLGEWRLCTTPF